MADGRTKSHLICHPCQSRGPELPMSPNPDLGPAANHPTCTLFESCLAPLCPLDPASLKGIWYPDEEICRSRSQGGRPWIRSQRRIAKVAGHNTGYFTIEMLSRLVVIRKGITGLDPDLPEETQLRAWFQKRPERRDSSLRGQERLTSPPGCHLFLSTASRSTMWPMTQVQEKRDCFLPFLRPLTVTTTMGLSLRYGFRGVDSSSSVLPPTLPPTTLMSTPPAIRPLP
jgi:hypothetical protein